jgi:hypothetical protein
MINNLPIPSTRNFASAYALSLIVALLMAAASLAGLLFQSAIYTTDDLRYSFVPTDVVNLFIGLPILLGSMALARRGRLVGLLFWPGALFFVTYHYIAYAFAMPFTWQFVPYLALVALSVYTMYRSLTSVDAMTVQGLLKGAVPERYAGGVLIGFGVLFFVMQGFLLVQASTGQAALSVPELATAAADLLIIPVWLIGGVLLWRRQAFGYVIGAGLLFQASMLFIGLLVFFILQPFLAAVPFRLEDFVVISVMGLICFIPFGLFVRGVLNTHIDSHGHSG